MKLENYEPLLDMVIEHVPSPKLKKESQMSNYFLRLLSFYRSNCYWTIAKRVLHWTAISRLVKRDGIITKAQNQRITCYLKV